MSDSNLRIVVSGLAGTYPLGGMFWHYMQFVLGLRRLGHDVMYVEDTGRWCYDPQAKTFVECGAANAALIEQQLQQLDEELASRWHFRDAADNTYGQSWQHMASFCKSADLFINISASAMLREEYRQCRRLVFIDTDPMYTQASIPEYLNGELDEERYVGVESLLKHDVFFTVGENVGKSDCLVPNDLVHWNSIRQPVVLDCFADQIVPVEHRHKALTTVASWDPKESLTKVHGQLYYGKSVEFENFIELPQHSRLPLEIALSGKAPTETLIEHGWQIRDGHSVSQDPWMYRDYLRHSFGEWSVAKHGYVASRSGWFSGRTASYLALGVPAVVQATGNPLPTGNGLFTFATLDEAAAAIDEIAAKPRRHSAAARELAVAYFDSDTVLSKMIDKAG